MQTAPLDSLLLWDVTHVATVLCVSESTVQNLSRTGQLPCVKCGKHKRWVPAQIRAYVTELAAGNGRTSPTNRPTTSTAAPTFAIVRIMLPS